MLIVIDEVNRTIMIACVVGGSEIEHILLKRDINFYCKKQNI